jgi:hypothetical protein
MDPPGEGTGPPLSKPVTKINNSAAYPQGWQSASARALELQLRLVQLEQISAKTLLEIKSLLQEILAHLAAGKSPSRTRVRKRQQRQSGDWWRDVWRGTK